MVYLTLTRLTRYINGLTQSDGKYTAHPVCIRLIRDFLRPNENLATFRQRWTRNGVISKKGTSDGCPINNTFDMVSFNAEKSVFSDKLDTSFNNSNSDKTAPYACFLYVNACTWALPYHENLDLVAPNYKKDRIEQVITQILCGYGKDAFMHVYFGQGDPFLNNKIKAKHTFRFVCTDNFFSCSDNSYWLYDLECGPMFSPAVPNRDFEIRCDVVINPTTKLISSRVYLNQEIMGAIKGIPFAMYVVDDLHYEDDEYMYKGQKQELQSLINQFTHYTDQVQRLSGIADHIDDTDSVHNTLHSIQGNMNHMNSRVGNLEGSIDTVRQIELKLSHENLQLEIKNEINQLINVD